MNDDRIITYAFRIAHFDPEERKQAPEEDNPIDIPPEETIGESPPENSMFFMRLRLFEITGNDDHKQVGAVIREMIAKQEFTFSLRLLQETLDVTRKRASELCISLVRTELIVRVGQQGRMPVYRLTVHNYPPLQAPGPEMINLLHEFEIHPESTRDGRISAYLLSRIADNRFFFTTAEWMTDTDTSQTVAVADIRRALNKGLISRFQLKTVGTGSVYVINTDPQPEISLDNITPRNREYITRLFSEFGCELFSVEQCAELLGITPSSAYFNLCNYTECGVMDCHNKPGRANNYQFKITPADHPDCFETPPTTVKTSRHNIAPSCPMVAASA